MRTIGCLLLLWSSSAFAAELLSVEQAEQRALEVSFSLRQVQERSQAAVDQARSVQGQLLPGVAISDELQHYRTPFAIAFVIPGAPVSPTFVAREQNTNTFVAAVRQPVLGLARLSQEYVSASAAAEAGEASVLSAQRATREAVDSGILRLFEARSALEVARASEKQLGDQLEVGRARREAGSATNADILRVEVALANVKQQGLQAQLRESGAKTQLLTLLDLPLGSDVDFASPAGLEAQATGPIPPLEAAVDQAVRGRAELVQLERQAESAEAASRARLLGMLLPEVDAEAAYLRVSGQVFAETESAFIGGKLTWSLWSWGSQWYGHRAASHLASAARAALSEARRNLAAEVSGRRDQLQAASAAIEVAKKALESAEEAYRVTDELVRAGSGTTTDLLDSQSALAQSKLNLVSARYQQALAWVQLRRALGG